MNAVSVSFQGCPWTKNGTRDINFEPIELRHAAVAYGRGWRFRGISTADKAHNEARIQEIISTVNLDGNRPPCVTNLYRAVGSTERAAKSFILGNAFCALIAKKELDLPWLVDIEALPNNCNIYFKGTKRADFIGKSKTRKWYVFESKGRSSYPTPKSLDYWKTQTDSIGHINGQKPEAKIVSATYVLEDRIIRAIWQDPPPEGKENIELPEDLFFKSYYSPILKLIEQSEQYESWNGQRLAKFPNLGMSVGLHSLVRDALNGNDFNAIEEFARSGQGADGMNEQISKKRFRSGAENLEVFDDGVIIRTHI